MQFLSVAHTCAKLLTRNMSVKRLSSVLGLQDIEPRAKMATKKKKQKAVVPGIVNLEILGNGSNGSPASVYLFTDQSRYLFNCGEGTQRLANEHKKKLSRLEQIFLTRNTWPMLGGIPGLTLTVQEAGVRELTLRGPPHLDDILNGMNRFVVLNNLEVQTADCTKELDYEDAAMTVKSVPLWHRNIKEHTDSEATALNADKVVIAYICKLKPRAGALNLVKCAEFNVPPGPLLGRLKEGCDITLPDGTVVKSTDVSDPAEKPVAFIFLDIPSIDFLPALQTQEDNFYDLGEYENALVVHFTPDNVVTNNVYRNFMEKFSNATQHIFVNGAKNSFSGNAAAHRLQYQLNQLDSQIFPLLAEAAELALSPHLEKEAASDSNGSNQNIEDCAINCLTSFHIRPLKGIDYSAVAKLLPGEYIKETQILEGFPLQLAELKTKMTKICNIAAEKCYPQITFLGTGSCIPNKTRNVSSILVETKENCFVLLDCGEGTTGQIIRFFGKTKAADVIRNIKLIYISHLHADHHLGLMGLLHERMRLESTEKVLVFAPRQISFWLNFYDSCLWKINDAYELIPNGSIINKPMDLTAKAINTGIASVQTCLVRHCLHSFGVRLTLQSSQSSSTPADSAVESPISITYSGDTMPCADLVELGHKTTILIHEATMEDDLIEEARVKTHSTISQAIEQGRHMEAQYTILTHFSQRYAKLPRIQFAKSALIEGKDENTNAAAPAAVQEENELMANVAIAFDNMQVTLPRLAYFHVFYPSLRTLFAEHADLLEERAYKREMKLERKLKAAAGVSVDR